MRIDVRLHRLMVATTLLRLGWGNSIGQHHWRGGGAREVWSRLEGACI